MELQFQYRRVYSPRDLAEKLMDVVCVSMILVYAESYLIVALFPDRTMQEYLVKSNMLQWFA